MKLKSGVSKLKSGSKAEIALYVCFALYIVNIYLARTIYVIAFPSIVIGGVDIPFGTVRTIIGIVLSIVAICLYKVVDKLIQTRTIMMGSAIANLVGTVLLLLSSHVLLPNGIAGATLIVVTGYVFVSASGTLLALVIAHLFVENKSDIKYVAFAFFAAMVINAAVALVGFFAHAFLQIALPFVVWWLWGFASSQAGSVTKDKHEINLEDVSFGSLAAKYLFFIFAFSLSTSFSRWQYLSDGTSDSLIRCVTMLLITALVGLVIYITKQSYLRFNSIALYRATFLFFILSLCMMLLAPKLVELTQSTQFVGDMILRTLIFVTVYRICQRYGMSITLVLCTGALVRSCASILFNLAEGIELSLNTTALVGIMILLLVLVYTVVFTERNLETLTERRKPRSEELIAESKLAALGKRYGLTKREMEVAKLLSQGRTVAFIADELFVSPRTVSTHVTNIYNKMDVHTRQDFLDIFQETRSEAIRSIDKS